MQMWIRKSIVVMISILTFGLVTPPTGFLNGSVSADNTSESENFTSTAAILEPKQQQISVLDEKTVKEKFVEEMVKTAENQSYQKFGQKIKPVIEDEFKLAILPNIEKSLKSVAEQFPEEDFSYLMVSEQPGSGNSERIFHISHKLTNEDIIRFHVRRDHPPQQGYWFNFHFHTYHDQFQKHHSLGSIYWDKNTPPNWMS